MIAVDEHGIITLFNNAAEELTEIKANHAIGKHVLTVISNSRLPYVLQTGESELNKQQPLGDIMIVTNRMPVRDDNGDIIGAIAVFRDVTELKYLAVELSNVNEVLTMLQAVFDAMEDAISVVDQDGQGLFINPAYTKLTGLTESDVVGKDCKIDLAEGESIHLEVLRTLKPVKQKRLTVGRYRREVVCDAAPIMVHGQCKGSVAVIHDLTHLNQVTRELSQAKQIIRKIEAKYTFDDIKGSSISIQTAIERARMAAKTPATVILRGESGTGKELFAHAIHNESDRRYNQFVRVNCAAISESLLESELFGYEEGAFTGAAKGGRRGFFEEANGGTIFLDEIGEIPLSTQAKLLRVLQEKEIMRVGSNQPIEVNVRVISATNVNLEDAVQKGNFRQDLYYRLNVFPVEIPSLSERLDDITEIANSFIEKFNNEYGRHVASISPWAMNQILAYKWPGNVRELENFIGRAMINMKFNETVMQIEHLAKLEGQQAYQRNIVDTAEADIMNLSDKMAASERAYIMTVLHQCNGNREETAKVLGISLRNLYYKMKKHQL